MEAGFEILSHTADTGIEARAPDLPGLFAVAGRGMFALQFECSADASPQERAAGASSAGTIEELLVAWLGELLYLAESGDLAGCSVQVDEVTPGVDDGRGRVRGRLRGVGFEGAELIGPPIKAVTYHDLAVEETEDGFRARIVFDV